MVFSIKGFGRMFKNIYFDSEDEFNQFVSSDYRAIESETFSGLSSPPDIVRGKIPVILYVLRPGGFRRIFVTPPNNLYRIVKYWNKDIDYEDKLTPLKVKVVLLSLIEENGVEVKVDEKFIRDNISIINWRLRGNTKYFSIYVENLNFNKGARSDKKKIIKELLSRKDEIYFKTFDFLTRTRDNVYFEIVGDSYSDLIMEVKKFENDDFGFSYYNIKLI